MGAIVGGLYAVGYTPSELGEIARNADWETIFGGVGGSPRPPESYWAAAQHVVTLPMTRSGPALPSGIISGQPTFQLLAQLTWPAHRIRDFSRLRVPFATVAVDVATGEAVSLRSGYLPDAIQASMALPGIFEPVTIGGRSFIDGGVVRNLPARDALDLGATVLICSDVSDPLLPADSLNSALETMTQVMFFAGEKVNAEQQSLCDAKIRMRFARGTSSAFDRSADLIAFGDSSARASIEQILAITDGAQPVVPTFARQSDMVQIHSASVVSGGDPVDEVATLRALGLRIPGAVSAEGLDRALSRAFETGRFRSIRYEVEEDPEAPEDSALTLVLTADPADPARFGFGLRYESRYKASLLLTSLVHGFGRSRSDVRVDLRLGQQIRLAGSYFYRSRPGLSFAGGGGLGYTRAPFDLFEAGQAVAELRFDSYVAEGLVGVAYGPRIDLGLRLHVEHLRGNTAVAEVASDTASTFYTVGGQLRANWYHGEYFPMRGAAVLARSEFAVAAIGSGGTFSHHVVDLQGHLPIHERASLMGRASLGTSTGDDLPLNYLFTLGGANPQFIWPDRQFPFFGIANQQLNGRAIQRFSLGIRVEPVPRLFASVEWNTGTTYDSWTFDPGEYLNAYGATLGFETFAGGIAVRAGGSNFKERPTVQIDFGSQF
jgi:NTE family protein